MQILRRSSAACFVAAAIAMGIAPVGHAQNNPNPDVLVVFDGNDLRLDTFYQLRDQFWTGVTDVCMDFVIEDPFVDSPEDCVESSRGGLYFGLAESPNCGLIRVLDLSTPEPDDTIVVVGPNTCNYGAAPVDSHSAFTTAIDLRSFASGTPITLFPTYSLQTDGSGDILEIFVRVNLEDQVFVKIASSDPLDTTVPTLFDFGTQTVEPLLLPDNAAGNFMNIEFRFTNDGVNDADGGGAFVNRLEFVGTSTAPGGGTTPDPDDTTAVTGTDSFTIVGSTPQWNAVTAGQTPLNPGQSGLYFGDAATDDYCGLTADGIFATAVDFTSMADTITMNFTYAYQTNDNPAEDLAEVAIDSNGDGNFTVIASSNPAAGGTTLVNDGVLRTVTLTFPAGTGGNFGTIRVTFTPDGDGTCGNGMFVAPTFTFTGTEDVDGGGGGGSSGGGGSACFIATAAYGTPVSNDINALRDVRDAYLMDNALGLAFVDAYYQVAPMLADDVAGSPALAAAVRVAITPVIAVSKLILQAPALMALLGLLSIALVAARRRDLARAKH